MGPDWPAAWIKGAKIFGSWWHKKIFVLSFVDFVAVHSGPNMDWGNSQWNWIFLRKTAFFYSCWWAIVPWSYIGYSLIHKVGVGCKCCTQQSRRVGECSNQPSDDDYNGDKDENRVDGRSRPSDDNDTGWVGASYTHSWIVLPINVSFVYCQEKGQPGRMTKTISHLVHSVIASS